MSEAILVKREGKVTRSGAGSSIYIKDEELEKAGIAKGEPVDVTVTADGKIVIKPKGVVSNVFLKFLARLHFDDAIKVGDAHIIPLVIDRVISKDYITVKEAQANQLLRFSDTGRIDRIAVSNLGDKGVLITQGQILEGKSQSRASTTNLILQGNESVEIPAKCVHSVQPIRAHAEMKFSSLVPRQVAHTLTLPTKKISQHHTWAGIKDMSASFMAYASSLNSSFADSGPQLRLASGNKDLASLTKSLHPISEKTFKAVKKHAKSSRDYRR